MKNQPDIVLSTIEGACDQERLQVVMVYSQGLTAQSQGGSQIELRQQSWGEGVGWFTQSSVQLQPHQVAGLRNALGSGNSGRKNSAKSNQLPRQFSKVQMPSDHDTASAQRSAKGSSTGFTPRILRADSA